LVGLNGSLGGITNSHASGAVTGTGQVELGGLVGGNFGSIGQSYATGPVTGSGTGMVGGLVGLNGGAFFHGNTLSGTITGSYASGPVAGTGSMRVGGLVGENEWRASIANSFATGAVTATAPGAVDIVAGGLVGENGGRITGSYATGAVTSHGGDATIGGLAGANDFWGTISNSSATGNVTADNAVNATAGGFVGGNAGTINSNSNSVISFATGNVSVNAVRGLAGGFVGLNLGGHIDHAYALGNVNVSGTTGIAGGFVGVNSGIAGEFESTRGVLDQTLATGAVSGSATNSVLGGLAGVNTNLGTISQAYATGTVSGGAGSIVGGLAAVNVGTLDQTYAIGKLTGGAIIGGLVAANTSAPLAPALINDPGIGPTLSGTGVATNSYWNSQTTGVATSAGGTARTTNELIATLPPGFGPAWAVEPNPTYPNFPWLPFNPIPIVPEPVPDVQPPAPAQPQAQTQIIDNLVNTVALTTPATAPVVNGLGPLPPPSYPPLPPPGGAQQQPQGFQRIVDIPPLTETRFVNDEVLLQITSNRTIAELEAALRSFGLTLIASQQLGSANTTMLRFRITNGQSVRDVIQRLASVQIVAIMQPNYVYVLAQQPAADPAVPASRGDVTQQNDVGQYILQKFKLNDVHRIVRGTNVPIAVIDSEIDAAHPDLQGVIAQRFSAVGAPEKPHPHGTGMAGAIASHQRLIGIAPSARLYAVHAFSSNATSAESTTFNILKGLDWASSNGARIINMSFAGPKDPSLERALKAAYDKGIVLIAAAGNAGPKSPPLYPGADPNVIAVTATDVDDKLFPGANRGKYVAVAAPGVDILVPAPDAGYQLTTGTSVAAAEVSGIVALLLERNPKLTPADIRRILTGSAKRLGTAERDDDFGSGLADPLRALQSADPRTVGTTPPLRQR
jgi:hypothetical protein